MWFYFIRKTTPLPHQFLSTCIRLVENFQEIMYWQARGYWNLPEFKFKWIKYFQSICMRTSEGESHRWPWKRSFVLLLSAGARINCLPGIIWLNCCTYSWRSICTFSLGQKCIHSFSLLLTAFLSGFNWHCCSNCMKCIENTCRLPLPFSWKDCLQTL